MYTKFFGFHEQPFSNTPDPRFYHQTRTHENALEALMSGITRKQGFLVLTGDVGTGKTTMCRTLLSLLGDSIDTALILNSDLSEIEILQAINRDLGLPVENASKFELMFSLYNLLVERAGAGRNTLIIIDDAQNLPPRSMEQVRMISNFETDKSKLVQIMLVGQPELNDMLDSREFRQIKQRIAVRPHLTPLSESETRDYIEHRLRQAGGEPEKIYITRRAVKRIYKDSGGYPRSVNNLCDHALMRAFKTGTRVIDKGVVREESGKLRLKPGLLDRVGGDWKTPILTLAASCAVVLAIGALMPWRPSLVQDGRQNRGTEISLKEKLGDVENSLAGLEEKMSILLNEKIDTVAVSSEDATMVQKLTMEKAEAKKLRLRLKTKEKELEKLQKDLLIMRQKESAEGDNPPVAKVISSMQEREADLKNRLEILREASRSKDDKIKNMERSFNDLQKKLSVIESEKDKLANNLQEKESLLASINMETGGADPFIAILQTENEDLKRQQKMIEDIASKTIKAQGKEIERLTKEKEILHKAFRKLGDSYASQDEGTVAIATSP